MKVLITGGSSLLGKALLETVPKQVEIASTWYTNYVDRPMFQLDVTNKSQVRYIFGRVRPEVVIHCAANGSVDYAEKNYAEVFEANVRGTENVVQGALDHQASVVFISTNAVFSGNEPPYAESDDTAPLNRYGSIKRQAEEVIAELQHYLIIRPFLFYGWPWPGGRGNWATVVIDKLNRNETMQVVDDVWLQPTYVPDCAEAIWSLIRQDRGGLFHIASQEKVTFYHFAQVVARVFGLNEGLIEKASIDDFPGLAPRPKDTTYNLEKMDSHGLKIAGIKTGLERMKREKRRKRK